mmetsp:Transcript_27285/g.55659  ORF Transcript_27285/g.55659 Transcript_27285/m.55659 type:complete len:314 (-) Transcript_27285:882-1823(-)
MCKQSTTTRKQPQPLPSVYKPFHKWLLGMLTASIFSIAYLVIPIYLLSAMICLLLQFPSSHSYLTYAFPVLLSILIPPMPSKILLRLLRPMLDYFDFETIQLDEDNIRKQITNGKSFLFAAQPHGIITYCGMCAAATNPDDVLAVPTAAASVVLNMPILKNLMGIFNLVDASASNIKRILSKKNKDGSGTCILIYIGGIAELFKSCRTEERLYLAKRKGFIKLALREGVDVIPIYLFGNTSVLSALKHGPLASLSRKFQVSLTLFWGKWFLPVPRDEKVGLLGFMIYILEMLLLFPCLLFSFICSTSCDVHYI